MAAELFSTPLYSDANLLAYYRLESTADSKGSYTLTNTGTTTFTAGQFNNAGTFNGSSQRLSNASLQISSGTSWTVNIWVKDTSESNAFRRFWKDGGDANAFLRTDSSGNIQLFPGGGTAVDTYKGSWHMFTTVSNGTNTKVYVDGNSTAIITEASCVTPTTGFNLGNRDGGGDEWFQGQLDDCAVFDRALTTTEISNLYNDTFPSTTAKRMQLLGIG